MEALFNRADVGNPDLAGDYCWVDFYFESPELDEPVYVYGQLSDWELCRSLEWITIESVAPTVKILLKQGYYTMSLPILGKTEALAQPQLKAHIGKRETITH